MESHNAKYLSSPLLAALYDRRVRQNLPDACGGQQTHRTSLSKASNRTNMEVHSREASRDFTLQVEHQQLPAGVLVGPVAEGQHGLLQEVGGDDLVAIVVVELPELPRDALFNSKPLSGRVTVEQEHLQEPERTHNSYFSLIMDND